MLVVRSYLWCARARARDVLVMFSLWWVSEGCVSVWWLSEGCVSVWWVSGFCVSVVVVVCVCVITSLPYLLLQVLHIYLVFYLNTVRKFL